MATDTKNSKNKNKKSENYYVTTIKDLNKLIDKGNFDKALQILVEEMGMPYIPLKFEDEFSKLFREVTLAIEEKETNSKFKTILKEEEIIEALNKDEVEPIHLELAINSLSKINIRAIMDPIKKLFLNKQKDDFIKTLVFIELVAQGIDEDITIIKNNKKIISKPSDLTPLHESKSLAYISRKIEEKLFQDQTQQLIAFGIMQTALVYTYPNEVEPNKYDLLACACHYMSSIYLRKEEPLSSIIKLYELNDEVKVLEVISNIQEMLDKRQTSFK